MSFLKSSISEAMKNGQKALIKFSKNSTRMDKKKVFCGNLGI